MKFKLIAAITAAFVMVAGIASAEVTPTFLGQDYFLSYTNNSTIADMNAYLIENEGVLEVEGSAAVGNWSSGEADMSKVVNGDVAYLNLDTAGDIVTNSLIAAEDMNNEITAKESGTGEAFIKATMLLVPSDEIEPSFVDAYTTNDVDWSIVNNGDLKFGLYAYEYDVTKTVTVDGVESEVIEVVTNLVVYHSYFDTPIELADGNLAFPVGYTNFVYEVPDNVDFTQPQEITVTLKQAHNQELFFKVNLGGTDVVSPKGCQEATILECPDGLPFCDVGPWLRCVNNGNVNTISAINFSGTGSINSLASGINTTGGGEGGDPDPVITIADFAGFADTTVGQTTTGTITYQVNVNGAEATLSGDSAFAITEQALGTVTVAFTPTEAKDYAATLTITAGNTTATLGLTAKGVEIPLTNPDDSAITDAALLAWLKGKGATQAQIDALGSAAALNEKYLLNLDLENSFYSLKIKSLTVGDDVKVEVELVRSNATAEVSAAINGELQLWGTADLGTDFADCGLTEISNDNFSDGTTVEKSFDAKGFKFFKAVIVAPTAAE